MNEPECPSSLFSPAARYFILVAMFIAALAVRTPHITDPPLEFHPTRQYHSAFIARMLYLYTLPSAPEEEKQMARTNQRMTGTLEPPIMEILSVAGYHLAGGERLWIPRAFAIIFWLIGGIFVFVIAARISSPNAALFSTALYLFLPFGIAASRSFQPEPLMVMLVLASIHAIARYYEAPGARRWWSAVLLSCLAALVKPVGVFLPCAIFFCMAAQRDGLRKAILNPRVLIFPVMVLLPFALYYIAGNLSGAFLPGSAAGRIMPNLLLARSFWNGWLFMVRRVIGSPALAVSLMGAAMVLFRGGPGVGLVAGFWLGYLAYGLLFTYHIHTHDYYQLPLIPIVAISIALPAELLAKPALAGVTQRLRRIACLGALVLIGVAGSIKGMAFSIREDAARQVAIAEEIGEVINHSRRTIHLSEAYGKPLRYHGGFCGNNWPHRFDLWQYGLLGKKPLTVEERFRAMNRGKPAEYFIVTELQEFEAQRDLKSFLTSKFPIMKTTADYIIFDLRKGT